MFLIFGRQSWFMGLGGDMRMFRSMRFAPSMNAVLLLLVVSLVSHWGLATGLASADEAPRSDIALERTTPLEPQNRLAPVFSDAHGGALFLFDHRIPPASTPSSDPEGEQIASRDLEQFSGFLATTETRFRHATIRSPRQAFQARAPPATS